MDILPRIKEQGKRVIKAEFDESDRIDSWHVQWNEDAQHYELIVNANRGNVGSGTCEFVYILRSND